jgi:hypothetical protein
MLCLFLADRGTTLGCMAKFHKASCTCKECGKEAQPRRMIVEVCTEYRISSSNSNDGLCTQSSNLCCYGANIGNDCNVCHCTTIETILVAVSASIMAQECNKGTYNVIRAAAYGADGILQCLEFHIVSGPATVERL